MKFDSEKYAYVLYMWHYQFPFIDSGVFHDGEVHARRFIE